MVSPHLPPDQGANALLPTIIASALEPEGVRTAFVSHPPRHTPHTVPAAGVTYVPWRTRGPIGRTPLGAAWAAWRIMAGARAAVSDADVVHLHSNGLIIEAAARVAGRAGRPWVITLYGTDVWHHEPARHARFGAVVRGASHRVFYSEELRRFAATVGLATEDSSVIYPPVSAHFRPMTPEARAAARRELGVQGPLLVTVKRLHAVGGQDDVLRAMPAVLERHPDARLILVGGGELRATLEAQARALGLGERVTFAGAVPNEQVPRFVAAADLFVLPSRLESWGAVMLEALACGTRVVCTASAGGREVQALFPDDVALAPVDDPGALGAGLVSALADRRGTSDATAATLASRFTPEACARAYLAVYERVRK
jgi:teichuronic acid biosynthesis glycosyltransferase TuaC